MTTKLLEKLRQVTAGDISYRNRTNELLEIFKKLHYFGLGDEPLPAQTVDGFLVSVINERVKQLRDIKCEHKGESEMFQRCNASIRELLGIKLSITGYGKV